MKAINTYINEKLRLTAKHQYTCQPKTFNELRRIIIQRIKDEGNECDLNDIDVSQITDMRNLFDADMDKIFREFNGDISMWNVLNVTNTYAMFFNCKEFNCDLSMWNMSNVENMNFMFYGCERFNCDLSMWNVSNTENMKYAFYNCPTTPKWYDKDKCED